jgi:hypothetical protein
MPTRIPGWKHKRMTKARRAWVEELVVLALQQNCPSRLSDCIKWLHEKQGGQSLFTDEVGFLYQAVLSRKVASRGRVVLLNRVGSGPFKFTARGAKRRKLSYWQGRELF